MSDTHPTAPAKPNKPYLEFPLFPHAPGQRAKEVRGKMHSFGLRADPDTAPDKYDREKEFLHAGRRSHHGPSGAAPERSKEAFAS